MRISELEASSFLPPPVGAMLLPPGPAFSGTAAAGFADAGADFFNRRFRFVDRLLKRVVVNCLQLEDIRQEIFHLCDRVGPQNIDWRPATLRIHDQLRAGQFRHATIFPEHGKPHVHLSTSCRGLERSSRRLERQYCDRLSGHGQERQYLHSRGRTDNTERSLDTIDLLRKKHRRGGCGSKCSYRHLLGCCGLS